MKLQVGVKALVERDGKYLFIRRPVGFDAGFQNWDIPGGRIEDDEPLRKALAREIKEEVSLAFGGGRLVAAQDIFVPEKDLHVVRLTYIGNAEGEVKVSDEHDVFQWMTLDEILREEHVNTYLREVIKSL